MKQTAVEFLQESLSIHFSFEQKMQFEGIFKQAKEIEKEQIYNEEYECVNMYLDDLNIPRKSEDVKEYSIIGRIKQLEKRYLKELSEVENHYLQQLNKQDMKIETQRYICPQTKLYCDDECCVSAEDCHIEAGFGIVSDCEQPKQKTLEEVANSLFSNMPYQISTSTAKNKALELVEWFDKFKNKEA